MKKINFKFLTCSSLFTLGTFVLYQYTKIRKVEKNTKEYIINKEPKRNYTTLFTIKEEQKRKYITLRKGK